MDTEFTRRLWAVVSRYGEPIYPVDDLVGAFLIPAQGSAFKTLPMSLVKANYLGPRKTISTICVDNDEPPEILCAHIVDNDYAVILNRNLIYHFVNLARQIFCMPDVLTFCGDANLQPDIEPYFNVRTEVLGVALAFNRYDTNTSDPFQAVSPNEEPLCEVRRTAYFALVHQMIEFLIVHEFAHIFLGHHDLLLRDQARRFDLGERRDRRLVNASIVSEVMADLVAVDWYIGAPLPQFRNVYSTWWSMLDPFARRVLRYLAPSVAYWAFSSHDAEFSMDIRNHGTAITGHVEDRQWRTHPDKTFRLEFINAAIDARLPGCMTSRPLLAKVGAEVAAERSRFGERLRFFSDMSLANGIIRAGISDELAEIAGSFAGWFGAAEPARIVPDKELTWPLDYLLRWMEGAPIVGPGLSEALL